MPKRVEWQNEAWTYFDEVPEVKELILWRSNQLSKLTLFVATIPEGSDHDAEPVDVLDPESGIPPDIARAATDELASMRAAVGGQSEIMRRLEINLEVPGEAWVVYIAERVPEPGSDAEGKAAEWLVASLDEAVARQQGEKTIWSIKRHPDDKDPIVLDPDKGDDMFRVWQPHGRWYDVADSALRGCLSDCELLMILHGQLKAESRSRASAGILAIPNELSVTVVRRDGEQRPDEDEDDPLVSELITALVEPTADPNHEATIVPLILRGPADAMTPEKLRHFTISREASEVLDRRIEGRVTRIARGMNAPVEVVMGLDATTFANAKQVDIDTFEDYLAPRAEFVCDAFTVGMLQQRLERRRIDPAVAARMFVWYNPAGLIAQPDPEQSADEGWKSGLISDAAWRRFKGFGEDDAPELQERLARIGATRGILTADLTAALLDRMADEANIELPSNPGSSESGEALAQLLVALPDELRDEVVPHVLALEASLSSMRRRAITAASERVDDGRRAGRALARLDADLRTRLVVAANDALERALERAGNRLRSRVASSEKAVLRHVKPALCAATLGRTLVAQAGVDSDELLLDAWLQLEAQFREWVADAQRQALDVVSLFVGGISDSERAHVERRQADALDDAWSWLSAALTTLAESRLFDPTPSVEPQGEFDPTLRVPPGLVRHAIARAGGEGLQLVAAAGDVGRSSGVGYSKGAVFVTLSQGGSRPAGGVGTGSIVEDVLRDHGGSVEGYVWDYGQAARRTPFEPHVALDGVEFVTFADDVLANDLGFPEFSHFMPGDHNGCMCDAIPVLLSGDAATATRSTPSSDDGSDDMSLPQQLDTLAQRYRDQGAIVELFESSAGHIVLSKIVAATRNQGLGSAFMGDLTALADELQRIVALTPSNDFGGNVTRLRAFYKRFGFVENKGRNVDHAISEAMYRLPQ